MGRPSRFELVGGATAVDLINTVSWRGDPGRLVERVGDFEALVAWSLRAGVIETGDAERLSAAAAAHPVQARRATTATHTLREDLHALFTAFVDTARPDARALAAVHAHVAAAVAAARPARELPLRWSLTFDRPGDLVHALALEALALLRDGDVTRIGRCADPACGWMFLDHSRNRSRRWCSSQDCGNRERVNRHRRQVGA